MNSLRGIAQETMELNLKSCAEGFSFVRDYLQDLGSIFVAGPRGYPERPRASEKAWAAATSRFDPPTAPHFSPAAAAAAAAAAEPRRVPLILAAPNGEDAVASFALTNPSATVLSVSCAVQAELPAEDIQLIPPVLTLAPGEQGIVRLKVRITDKLLPGRDYSGRLTVPGLSNQALDFIVRHLPGDGL